MRIAPLADVKANLSKFVEQCQDSPVVITKNGRPAAMLICITDEDDLERMLISYSPKLRRMLDQAAASARAGHKLGHDEFWAEVDRSNAEKSADL
jgi:prevent-host-death family protein